MHERLNSDELARFMLRAAGHPTAAHADLKVSTHERSHSLTHSRTQRHTHTQTHGHTHKNRFALTHRDAHTHLSTNKQTSKQPNNHTSGQENKQAHTQAYHSVGPTRLRQVLWINQHQRGDYMRDQLMVGMRHLVGARMVDWVKVRPPRGYI